MDPVKIEKITTDPIPQKNNSESPNSLKKKQLCAFRKKFRAFFWTTLNQPSTIEPLLDIFKYDRMCHVSPSTSWRVCTCVQPNKTLPLCIFLWLLWTSLWDSWRCDQWWPQTVLLRLPRRTAVDPQAFRTAAHRRPTNRQISRTVGIGWSEIKSISIFHDIYIYINKIF